MNMLRLSVSAIAASVILVACGGGQMENKEATHDEGHEAAQEEMAKPAMAEMPAGVINTETSEVQWKGEMLGVKDHTGTLKFKEGNVETTDGAVSGGMFVVDLTTMVATDDNYQPEQGYGKEKLIEHLSSADFFDVATYPTATFKITGMEGDKLMGELTIRDKTNPETVEGVAYDAESGMYKGMLTFNRMNYDVAWESTVKDAVLSDDISLTVMLSM